MSDAAAQPKRRKSKNFAAINGACKMAKLSDGRAPRSCPQCGTNHKLKICPWCGHERGKKRCSQKAKQRESQPKREPVREEKWKS
jgi:hypothetical protein